MAQKRMFSLSVIDTDRFLDMPVSAQALYFHLGMHGDDDGFVANPKKIARAAGCNDGDLLYLSQNKYIIPFESGVIVIVDWNANNTLKNDRYKPTMYQDEKALLSLTPAGRYVENNAETDNLLPSGSSLEPVRNQIGSTPDPQHNIAEHRITEHKVDGAENPPTTPRKQKKRFVPPSVDDVRAYCTERRNQIDPQQFVDFYTANGWTQGRGKPIKDWRAAVRTWEGREAQHAPARAAKPMPTAEDYDLDKFFGGA